VWIEEVRKGDGDKLQDGNKQTITESMWD